MELGQVYEINGVEHICTVVEIERDYAVVKDRSGNKIKLLGNKTSPHRILRTESVQEFLSRRAWREEKQTNNQGEENESENTVMVEKTSSKVPVKKAKAAKNTSMTGAADFIRGLCMKGVGKSETYQKAVEKFSGFAGNGKVYFDPRWETAVRLAKAKPETKKSVPTKKPTAKSVPARKPAKAAPVPKRSQAPAPAPAVEPQSESAPTTPAAE